jgi:hypothetical protein
MHGGARPGAGRKPKPRAPAISPRMSSSDVSAVDQARVYLALAIETLATGAGEGASESARVAAARVIIQTANGELRAAQGTADQRQDDADGWGDLLKSRQPARRDN